MKFLVVSLGDQLLGMFTVDKDIFVTATVKATAIKCLK